MAGTKDGKERVTNFERCWGILEYLKKNSDEEHTVTQASIRKAFAERGKLLGEKETSNKAIVEMAMSMNMVDDRPKPNEEQRIIFDDFKRLYGYGNADDTEPGEGFDMEDEPDDIDDEKEKKNMEIRHLYYNPIFSYEEINYIEDAILFSKVIDTETSNKLIQKIENELTSKYYRHGHKKICKVKEPDLTNQTELKDNLFLIQQAIDNHVKISFQFNGYNERRKLQPVKRGIDVVSPYYIVANGGRFYLIACRDMEGENVKPNTSRWRIDVKPNMSIWRIDLMTNLMIPEYDEKRGKYGIASIPKEKVENLPQEWSEDFHLSHLNMSFDEPEWITLRVKGPDWRTEADREQYSPDYTFLYDWFGDTFIVTKKGVDGSLDDEVKVRCSPYGMANWAMQYSDRVEVLEPQNVRQMVIDKIKRQAEKYGVK